MSQKPIKLEKSNSVHGFDLALPAMWKYNISEKGRGLGHVTPRIFGIPSNMSPKLVKLVSSKLVYSFSLALPTRLKYNISERGEA